MLAQSLLLHQEWVCEEYAELITGFPIKFNSFKTANTSDCLMDTEFSWGEMFWNQIDMMVEQHFVLNATELYVLKWLIRCYVSFPSAKKEKNCTVQQRSRMHGKS